MTIRSPLWDQKINIGVTNGVTVGIEHSYLPLLRFTHLFIEPSNSIFGQSDVTSHAPIEIEFGLWCAWIQFCFDHSPRD
jgi:hypothetical protein